MAGLKPGDVAVHGAFDAHLDYVSLGRAQVLEPATSTGRRCWGMSW